MPVQLAQAYIDIEAREGNALRAIDRVESALEGLPRQLSHVTGSIQQTVGSIGGLERITGLLSSPAGLGFGAALPFVAKFASGVIEASSQTDSWFQILDHGASSIVGVESALDRANKQFERQNSLLKEAKELGTASTKGYDQFYEHSKSKTPDINTPDPYYYAPSGSKAQIDQLQKERSAAYQDLEKNQAYQRMKALEKALAAREQEHQRYAAQTGRDRSELATPEDEIQWAQEHEKLKAALKPTIDNLNQMDASIKRLDAEYQRESERQANLKNDDRMAAERLNEAFRVAAEAAERSAFYEEEKRRHEKQETDKRRRYEEQARHVIERNDPSVKMEREIKDARDLFNRKLLTQKQYNDEETRIRRQYADPGSREPVRRPEIAALESVYNKVQSALGYKDDKLVSAIGATTKAAEKIETNTRKTAEALSKLPTQAVAGK